MASLANSSTAAGGAGADDAQTALKKKKNLNMKPLSDLKEIARVFHIKQKGTKDALIDRILKVEQLVECACNTHGFICPLHQLTNNCGAYGEAVEPHVEVTKESNAAAEASVTTFTAMQLDLGMVLRVLNMKDYGIGKKHYTYEGGGREPWTASPKSGAGGGVQPLWDALPAEIREAKCSSKKAALNKIKMGLAARLRRNATIEQCSALAVADAEALAKQEAWLASPKYQEQQAVAESKMKRRQALAKQKAWLASPEYQEQQALAEINMREQQARATYCVGTKVYLVGSGSKIIDGTITYMPPQISRDGRDIEVKWSGCGLSKYTFQELTDLNNAARGLMDSQINGAKELTKVAEEKVRTKVVAKYSFTKSSKSVYEEVTQQMEDYGETSCYTATITIEAFYGTVSLATWTASSYNGGSRISGNAMNGEMQEDGTTLKITHYAVGWSCGSESVNMVDLVALAQKKGLLTVSPGGGGGGGGSSSSSSPERRKSGER